MRGGRRAGELEHMRFMAGAHVARLRFSVGKQAALAVMLQHPSTGDAIMRLLQLQRCASTCRVALGAGAFGWSWIDEYNVPTAGPDEVTA